METTSPVHPTRRTALATLAAAVAAPALVRRAHAAPLPELVLHGPPAGPSVTLAVAASSGALREVADKVSFRVWRNPDEMRAGLTSGTMDLTVMPTTAAANLHNREFGLRLVNVMTEGLLYVVSTDRSIDGIAGLAGKRVVVPFRNDTPDIVLSRLLAAAALEPGRDLTLDTAGTPIEAMQMLLAGRMDAALVPEPAASAAIVRGKAAGVDVHRVVDIREEWAALPGGARSLPQAGLAVRESFLENHPERLAAIHEALVAATETVEADPARAANAAASALEMPWPVLEQSIPYSNLVARRASEARDTLESMYGLIAEVDPAKIGGRLPDAAFYL